MRLIDTRPCKLLDPDEKIWVALGNLPPPLMRKNFHTWKQQATPMFGEFAHALQMRLRPLQPIIPPPSSDDNAARESDDEESFRLTPPPTIQLSSAPPHKNCLESLNPKGKKLVGQHILYK